jgi:hypothetical protein
MRQLDIFGTNSYFNSVPIRDEKELDKLEKKARHQDEDVLNFFKAHPYQDFTPWQVHFELGGKYLIGSIRRAITNLTDDEELIMLDKKRMELQGSFNNVWKLNPEKI